MLLFRNEKLDVNTNSSNLTHALAEASQLTYVRGQWIAHDALSTQTEFPRCRIIAPTLPTDGNYSSYNEWSTYILKLNIIYLY